MSNGDISFLQGLKEQELCELVLIPLFARMGYGQVRFTHGAMEMGKDIVFSMLDPLSGRKHFAAVVKSQKFTGAASGNRSIREVYYQIEQALRTPYIDPLDGREVQIDTVFVVTPHPISQQSIASIREIMQDLRSRVRFIDGPSLVDLIRQFYPTLLESLPDTLPKLPEKQPTKATKKKVSEKAFILMPFKNPYDSYYPAIFKPALEQVGYEVYRADDVFSPQPIIIDIQESIKQADLILCEMSERNPNVFYELGLAHAIGKPVILVSHNEQDVPFDLRHIRIIFYNFRMAGWEEKLKSEIKEAALSVQKSGKIWPPPLI